MKFSRITVNPHQMNGVACIRGLRIPVATIVGALAEGLSEAEILTCYPDLESEDICEALHYTAEVLQEGEMMALDEFNAWPETIYLLSNPANAAHLRRSIAQAKAGQIVERELIEE